MSNQATSIIEVKSNFEAVSENLNHLHCLLVLFSDTDIENYYPEMIDRFLNFLLDKMAQILDAFQAFSVGFKMMTEF